MAESSKITSGIGGALKGASAGSAFGMPGTIAGALIGGIGGALAGGGEDDAKRLAESRAELIELETGENIRRTNVAKEQVTGQAKALIGASNLQNRYSPSSYVDALESSFVSDVAFQHLGGRERAKQARLGGQVVADQIRGQGISDLLSGIGTAVGAFGMPADKESTFSESTWIQKRRTGDDPFNIGWSSLGGG